MSEKLPIEESLRTTSTDLLKIYKYTFDHPNDRLLTSSKLGKVSGLEGRALGGVLAGINKTNYTPILARQGVKKISWSGKYESREQLWSINPQLPVETKRMIKRVLDQMILE